jgi:hypothetical protein
VREVDLIHAPCLNGILKIGVKAYDLCGVECDVTKLWCCTNRKKTFAELTRDNDISMRIPALMINRVNPEENEVNIAL